MAPPRDRPSPPDRVCVTHPAPQIRLDLVPTIRPAFVDWITNPSPDGAGRRRSSRSPAVAGYGFGRVLSTSTFSNLQRSATESADGSRWEEEPRQRTPSGRPDSPRFERLPASTSSGSIIIFPRPRSLSEVGPPRCSSSPRPSREAEDLRDFFAPILAHVAWRGRNRWTSTGFPSSRVGDAAAALRQIAACEAPPCDTPPAGPSPLACSTPSPALLLPSALLPCHFALRLALSFLTDSPFSRYFGFLSFPAAAGQPQKNPRTVWRCVRPGRRRSAQVHHRTERINKKK